MIPSLGGLGVREFSYLYFFAAYIGRENAIALSLINLSLIMIQSLTGGIVFLLHRNFQGRK